jgi:hypothetical protein
VTMIFLFSKRCKCGPSDWRWHCVGPSESDHIKFIISGALRFDWFIEFKKEYLPHSYIHFSPCPVGLTLYIDMGTLSSSSIPHDYVFDFGIEVLFI